MGISINNYVILLDLLIMVNYLLCDDDGGGDGVIYFLHLVSKPDYYQKTGYP